MWSTFKLFGRVGLVILISHYAYGQKFIPHTFTAGIDLPGVVRSIATEDRTMGELQLGTNLASHMFIVEYGFENITRSQEDYQYKTRGPYFRSGIDFTLNPKNPQGHKIFTGFRYAQSNFKNSLDYNFSSEPFNDPQLTSANNSLRGTWLEFTFGMKILLNTNLVMGYTMRYKFSQNIKGVDALRPFDLPGYGRASKDNNFGLSYYLLYRIKFRKEREVSP